ncbi:60S ribosomal protein l19 [Grosmannia clavigera kw1407]|uniref:60S ribosomal protein l19 n=1 Tax=Grosmannia clavigera (strain kw1407 / UAMH 11150) TaxID=655863 RepID=F0XGQ3_GROCL|nr:60S ribosomal protein l19 [Grosmannia clavigera kw1407]EFX03192.1 60S ribosomal protein l19 [Grosmannia clavigera kw1407]
MSPSVNGGTSTAGAGGSTAQQWPPRRPSKRSKLRNSTFIIPSTGERSRRQFTLRNGSPSVLNGYRTRRRDYDENDDGDENEDDPSSFFTASGFSMRMEAIGRASSDGLGRFRAWMESPNGRGVIKCTVAYTIASLWTFWAPLSDLLGKPDGKHLVATITVYFHPARSAGSMIEAGAISVVAVAYAEIISVLSMAASVLFGSVLGWVTFAYAVVLVFFIGFAFGFIGWVKQRLNNPSVNVGCTLASLAIITVVTKENATYSSVFSNTKIVQVLKILVFGICTTSSVSLLLWRVSARALLRESLTRASTSLGDMLAMITHGFLSGAEDELTMSAEYGAVSASWTAAHAQMTKNLREAKYEHYAVGHASLYQLEKSVYKSMETLAQSIGGLRSAANTQFELLREAMAAADAEMDGFMPSSPAASRPGLLRTSSNFQRGSGAAAPLAAIDEASDESTDESSMRGGRRATGEDGEDEDENDIGNTKNTIIYNLDNINTIVGSPGSIGATTTTAGDSNGSRRGSTATLRTSTEIFELFIGMLGPSMKSLAFTLAGVLRDPPFGSSPDFAITVNGHYRQSLADALVLYNGSRAAALQELYKTIEFGRPRSEKIKADFEEVAAACGHFSFSLQAFGEEMTKYLDVLDDLRIVSTHDRRSWRWLLFWKAPQLRFPSVLPFESPAEPAFDEAVASATAAGTASMPNPVGTPAVRPIRKSQMPRGIPDTMVQRRDTFSWQAAPQANTLVRSFAQELLRLLRVLMRDDIRFGIKVGIGAMLWACMAFTPETRKVYMHWRGEWGLLSFMIVCSNTVGASNTTAIARFLATLSGAAVAVLNWNISQGHAVPLLLLGWLVAFYSFYVMIDRGKTPVGRTTLLAYNVITLYAYLLSQRVDDDDDDEGGVHPFIMEIAKHRFLAVTAGILWGLIVCRVVWPNSARHRFQEGVSVLYLQMGLIWKRGPLAMLLRADGGGDSPDGRNGSGIAHPSYLRSGEQAALQRYAARLETLRQSAGSEFELRGPFPFTACGRVMAATNRILDGFYAMSLLTQRRAARLTDGERALLLYTAPERAMLCDRICHVFQVLASSFMLEYPLADALPSVTIVRDRLLAKIFHFRKEQAAATAGTAGTAGTTSTFTMDQLISFPPASPSSLLASPFSDLPPPPGPSIRVAAEEQDYALLYAYALITGQVAEELRTIAKEFEGLFGVLDEDAMLLQ